MTHRAQGGSRGRNWAWHRLVFASTAPGADKIRVFLLQVIRIGCQEKPRCSRGSLAFVLAIRQAVSTWDHWEAGVCRQPRSFYGLFAPCFSPYMVSSSIFQAGRGERGPGRDPQWLERRDRLSRVCSWELGWKRHFLWLFVCREHWEQSPAGKQGTLGLGWLLKSSCLSQAGDFQEWRLPSGARPVPKSQQWFGGRREGL